MKKEDSHDWMKLHFELTKGSLSYSKIKGVWIGFGTMLIEQRKPVQIDLKLCSVKESSGERDFCFVLSTPTRVFVMAAESKEDATGWIQGIKYAISDALRK